MTKPQHIHKFFTQIFLKIFLVKSKLSTAKKSKTTTFSRVFHPKNRQFSREIKVEFLDEKWRFRTVCKNWAQNLSEALLGKLNWHKRTLSCCKIFLNAMQLFNSLITGFVYSRELDNENQVDFCTLHFLPRDVISAHFCSPLGYGNLALLTFYLC